MKITIADIMAKHPCDEYPLERIQEIANGRESITLMDVLYLGIPFRDRIWLITRFLDDRNNRLFAADCAERAVMQQLEPDSSRRDGLLMLIEYVRDCAEARITADELRIYRDAAYTHKSINAAVNAAAYAAINAAINAATYYYTAGSADTACYTADYAANAAADADVEREWQLDRLRYYVTEREVS